MPLPTTALGGRVQSPLRVSNVVAQVRSKSPAAPVVATILKDSWTDVAAGSTTAFLAAGTAGPNTTTTTVTTFDGALSTGVIPVGRNVVVTVAHASSVVAMSGTITGKDRYGRVITEAWSVTAGTTSKTFTGSVSFKEITSITLVAAGNATANTVTFGTGNKLGLSFPAAAPRIIAETEDGATPTAGVLVAASSVAGNDRRGTYTPNSTPNGAKDFVVWYLVEDATAI